jgi:outer membrane protein assembly factor BamD
MLISRISAVFIFLSFFNCASNLDKALKSTDKAFIIQTAKEYYDKKKYEEAILLYDKSGPLLTNTEETKEVTYFSALSNQAAENYITAAHQFNVFHINYPTSPLAENALFQSAMSLYKISPEYNLDPEYTQDAINRFQSFANTYPDSQKVVEATKKIEELRGKLEKKSFSKAMLYYKILNFKSATSDFKNFLEDYPETKRREEVLYLIFISDFNLAIKSIKEKKEERIKNALNSYNKLIETYSQSKYTEEIAKLKKTLLEEQKQLTTL